MASINPQNKRIFITGGASGLGQAIAHLFAKKGYKVAIGDINEPRLEQTKTELLKHTDDVLTFKCNTTKTSDLEQVKYVLVSTWGGIDIVVNNAGIGGTAGSIDEVSLADWETIIDVNVMGVVRGCKIFSPLLKTQKAGAIVNIASSAALFTPPYMSSYNVSKSAIVGLSETLRSELASFQVSTHVVCPGFFKTNLTDSIKSKDMGMNQFVEAAMAKSPIDANDIAIMIHRQIEANQFLLIPHKMERRMWYIKRYLPRFLESRMKKLANSIARKVS